MLLLGMMAMSFAACRDFSFSSFMRGDALATVGDQKLYIEDVQVLFTGDITPEDSLKLLNSYVDQWVKQQLKIQEAGITSPEEEARIDRMVDDYRNSLLIYEHEKKYIERHLDTVVTQIEISQYYDEHFEEFKLSVPLLKGVIVRVPVGFRQEGQMRIMAISGTPERLQDMIDIAMKNNFAYREFNEWVELGEVTAVLPPLTEQEHARLLSASPMFEVTQGDTRYFVVVTGVLRAGSPIPLARASETIRTLIITRRKQELLRRMEDELYRQAIVQKEITITIDTLINTNEQPIEE